MGFKARFYFALPIIVGIIMFGVIIFVAYEGDKKNEEMQESIEDRNWELQDKVFILSDALNKLQAESNTKDTEIERLENLLEENGVEYE